MPTITPRPSPKREVKTKKEKPYTHTPKEKKGTSQQDIVFAHCMTANYVWSFAGR
jgi:hypothetical protein